MLADALLGKRFEKFSELTISDSLREASKLMYESMTVGLENAEKYAAGVNETATNIKKGLKSKI